MLSIKFEIEAMVTTNVHSTIITTMLTCATIISLYYNVGGRYTFSS